MNRILLMSGLALLLSSCSSLIDKPTQKITIETPGTDNAICYLLRPGFRDRVWTPTTVRMTKSAGPLTVDCIAAGNREKKVVINPVTPRSFYGNYATLMLGGLYDRETGAMYQYPDTVTVDFTDVPASKMPLPGYQTLFAAHPELVGMDVTRPGLAALPGDRTAVVPELQPRGPDNGGDTLLGGDATDLNVITGAPGPGDTDNDKLSGSAAGGSSSATSATSGASGKRSSSAASSSAAESGRPQFIGQGKSIFDSSPSSTTTITTTTSTTPAPATPSDFVGGTAAQPPLGLIPPISK